jgi:hypothetical protein
MRFWFDTEFLEDGNTIELISIGIVAEDGREYYAVNANMPTRRIAEHKWLRENVWVHLPLVESTTRVEHRKLDMGSVLVREKRTIANEVRHFLTQHNGPVELWGYYSAYDHVVLAQLWGTMMQLPKGIPMWTNDVQQVAAAALLYNRLPQQTGTAHNALDDARWTRDAWTFLRDSRAV